MGNIEKISGINPDSLDSEHYFQSLIEQGCIAQLLSEFRLEELQLDCLTLLAKKTEQFNGGDSSSIPVEKAQDFLASVLFTVGVQLKTYPCPDDAVAALLNNEIQEIYAEGRRRINTLISRAKVCHTTLIRHLFQTPNVFYTATIVEGIKGFFKLYDPDFAAHDINITADYPVYNRADRLLGIEFIGQYLEQLYFENQFLLNFSTEDIHFLLLGYDSHYEELLFNLYEPVLAASLGCIIAGINGRSLMVTPQIQSFLQNYFEGKSVAEILEILAAASVKLGSYINITGQLQGYINNGLQLLAAQIEIGVKIGNLGHIFITPKYPENNPKLLVEYGEKMDDELYRRVIAEFMDSQNMADKTDLIKEHIHSLTDLNDLLLDSELNEKEIAELLKICTPAQVAALTKKYTANDEDDFSALRDCEKTLAAGLKIFSSALPAEQQAALKKAVEILEINYK